MAEQKELPALVNVALSQYESSGATMPLGWRDPWAWEVQNSRWTAQLCPRPPCGMSGLGAPCQSMV